MASEDLTVSSPQSQTGESPPKKKLRRSRAGCKRCKNARKKCDEVHPTCRRCAVRGWQCDYRPSRDRYQSRSPPLQSTSPPNGQNYVASTLPNIANILNPSPVIGTETSSQSPRNPWMREFNRVELVDFAGSLDFIESAFPRISHVSPTSAASVERPNIFDVQQGLSLSGSADLNLGLWEHEQAYLRSFEQDFWSAIVRKEEQPALVKLHFSQLAGFEPLKFAVLAVGAAYKAQSEENTTQRQAELDESIRLHSKAVRGLKVSIGNETRPLWNSIIACTFCLFFYELIRGDITTTSAQHLLGALHLMKIDTSAGLNSTSTFHHKLFRYYDVIAALSLGRRPLTGSLTYQEKEPNPLLDPVGEQISTDPYGCVDNVFGLGTTFWPLLHRLAQLTRKDEQARSSSFGSSAYSQPAAVDKHQRISLAALELSIKEWKPQLELHAINMEHAASDSSLQSLMQSCQAYQHAALIHLYRHYGEDHDSPRVQHAVQSALQCCLRVMVFGQPYGGLLWPLFTAGASAVAPNHRNIASTVFDQLSEVQGLDNIAKAKSLMLETWTEMDATSHPVKWQEVAGKLGWTVVLA